MTQLARHDAPGRMPLPEFLAWETAQPLRHERVGGTVWAITGGTLNHNRIALNLFSALRSRLRGTACEAFALDVRVVTPPPSEDVMYPDVVVVCGEGRGAETDVRDPTVIAEVLSPGTMARDHGFKRWAYGTIPTLKHYVLVAQDRPEAEVATADGEIWRSVVLRDATASLRLDALGLEIPLAEVFAGVDLTPEEPQAGQA
ncbi:MAG: Uma2 family endonuclease [Geminicoccaceae bacterium]